MDNAEKNDQFFLRRMQDLMERAGRIGYPVYTDFLDGHQRALLMRYIASGQAEVRTVCFGGYQDAERVIAAFYPSFLSFEVCHGLPVDDVCPIEALRIEIDHPKFLRRPLVHRDYLGALMGLQIRRERMGDILPDETGAYVIVMASIVDFLLSSLTSVGSNSVNVRRSAFSCITRDDSDGEEMMIQVASMRLDSVISQALNCSRSESSGWIRAGRVKVNWQEVTKTDYELKVSDIVSVHGSGRIRIGREAGSTRSGKIRLSIIRFR